MPDERAHQFLQMIRRSQRGRLKVYLGFAPGVGKTYQMLSEAHRLKADGVDVVIGVVEHHGRAETRRLIDGLEQVPLRAVEYHGIRVEEMDIDAILARRPQVCLVDELAHTNVPGSKNAKRYQDVQDLLSAGIHVIAALNVQHLETLNDTVERLVGVRVRERLPDAVLADADEVVNVDLATEDLQKRLRDGKIYPKERVDASLENFFTGSNLEHLRELTLRELASQIDSRRRESRSDARIVAEGDDEGDSHASPDQVMVCLSSRGPNSAKLLRYGSRLAGRMNRNWYALYVQTPREGPTVIDATTQRLLADTLTLANQLGATVFTFKGSDVPDTILRFAGEYRCGNIVIGSPHPIPWWRRLLGERSVAERLILRQKDVTVIVVDADQPTDGGRSSGRHAVSTGRDAASTGHPSASPPDGSAEAPKLALTNRSADAPITIASLLSAERVLVMDEAISRAELLRRLVDRIAETLNGPDRDDLVRRVEAREARGSTFLNEGIALPHARVPGLVAPIAALAVTKGGVSDVPTEVPIQAVFLLLTPEKTGIHLAALGTAGRLLNDRTIRQQLVAAADASAVMHIIGVDA